MTILKRGSMGFNVLRLRLRLDLSPSIYFDDETAEAVMKFQKAHKLKVDGEVGPITRTALDLKPAYESIPINLNKLWLAIAWGEKDPLSIARKEIGVIENSSKTLHNPRIVEYHQTTVLKATTDEIAWCAAFVGWIMTKFGRPDKYSAAAKDWLDWTGGDKVTNPEPGDIVIVRTVAANKDDPDDKGTKGYHVGFYLSKDTSHVRILGGNQNNQVKESNYPLTGKDAWIVKGYRRPKPTGTTLYMKFGNIVGSATAKGYEGWMKIKTFTFGVKRNVSMEPGNLSNREPGRPQISRIAITREMDRSAAALFQAAVKGTAGVDVTIVAVATGNKVLWERKLSNVILSDYAQYAQADDTPLEGLSLSYSRTEIACTDHDASGKACGTQRVAYDVGAGRMA